MKENNNEGLQVLGVKFLNNTNSYFRAWIFFYYSKSANLIYQIKCPAIIENHNKDVYGIVVAQNLPLSQQIVKAMVRSPRWGVKKFQ